MQVLIFTTLSTGKSSAIYALTYSVSERRYDENSQAFHKGHAAYTQN
jgi:hypothetical protein